MLKVKLPFVAVSERDKEQNMNKLINSSEQMVQEMLAGYLALHSDRFCQVAGVMGIKKREEEDKVSVVIAGGSGNEPWVLGFVGDGLADGAASRKCNLEAGFKMAAEAAEKGVEYTKEIRARFGRAKYFGDKAIGVQDAGATSVGLMFRAY